MINFMVTSASIEVLGMGLMIAKICGTGSAFVWNYAARQFFVFDRNPRLTGARALRNSRLDRSIRCFQSP